MRFFLFTIYNFIYLCHRINPLPKGYGKMRGKNT